MKSLIWSQASTNNQDTDLLLTRNASVLLGRANVIKTRSFIRQAMFDWELEWTEGVGGGKGERTRNLHSPTPPRPF